MDRFGARLLHGMPCVTQKHAATLQDVQPEKGPVDLRLGADQSLDSRLARVASLAVSGFPTVSLPGSPSGPSGPLAGQSPRPFYCGLLPTIRPSHTSPDNKERSPAGPSPVTRLARLAPLTEP